MSAMSQEPAYRWVIVFVAAVILAIAMGAIINGMSAFIVPMQEAHGWQRGDVALINFSGIIGLAFGGLITGPLADKYGTRPIVLFGVTVLGLCYFTASFLTSLWPLYGVFFIAGFLAPRRYSLPFSLLSVTGFWLVRVLRLELRLPDKHLDKVASRMFQQF